MVKETERGERSQQWRRSVRCRLGNTSTSLVRALITDRYKAKARDVETKNPTSLVLTLSEWLLKQCFAVDVSSGAVLPRREDGSFVLAVS